MEVGSDVHRDLFCHDFIATYTAYEPRALPWPTLTDAELQRLKGVPFWEQVLHTERLRGRWRIPSCVRPSSCRDSKRRAMPNCCAR